MIRATSNNADKRPRAIRTTVVELNPEDSSASRDTFAAAASRAAIFSAIKESLDAFSSSRFCNSDAIFC